MTTTTTTRTTTTNTTKTYIDKGQLRANANRRQESAKAKSQPRAKAPATQAKKHRPKAEKHDQQKAKSGPGAQYHVMPLICFSMARTTLHFSYPTPRTFCWMASWWCWRLFEDSNHIHNLTNPSWWGCNCRTTINPAHLTNAPEPGIRQTPPTDRTLAEHKKHTVLNQYSISLLFHLYVC